MQSLIQVRHHMINLYKSHESVITFALKLLMGLFVFSKINAFDLLHPTVYFLSSFPFTCLFALCFAFLPVKVAYLLIILVISAHLSAFYPVAILAFLFLLCIYIFYIRMAPKESILIVLTMIALYFKIPYAVVLIAGIYMGATAIIPIIIAVFLYYFSLKLTGLLTLPAETLSIAALAKSSVELYASAVHGLAADFDWIAISFVFVLMFFLVFAVSRSSIPYAKGLAIIGGIGFCWFGFFVIGIIAHVQIHIVGVLFFSLLSGLLVSLLALFDVMLHYEKTERVQFEDDENIYYVKIIPKLDMAKHSLYPRPNDFSKKTLDIPLETKKTMSRIDEINERQKEYATTADTPSPPDTTREPLPPLKPREPRTGKRRTPSNLDGRRRSR